jgi:hypothetical protein
VAVAAVVAVAAAAAVAVAALVAAVEVTLFSVDLLAEFATSAVDRQPFAECSLRN